MSITKSRFSRDYNYSADEDFQLQVPKVYESNKYINTEYAVTVESVLTASEKRNEVDSNKYGT